MFAQSVRGGFQCLRVQKTGVPVRKCQHHFRCDGLPQLHRAGLLQPAGEVEGAVPLRPVSGSVLHHNGDSGIGIVVGDYRLGGVGDPNRGIILGFSHQRSGLGQGIGDGNSGLRQKFRFRRRGVHHDKIDHSPLGTVLQGQ